MRARVFTSAALAAAILVSAVAAQQPADPEPVQLPARRVILYKSGVGYFEHVGNVSGSREVAIQFTSGQLNDVLKSLTALDLDNGQISAINYNSVAPIDQRLRALRVPLGFSRRRAAVLQRPPRGAGRGADSRGDRSTGGCSASNARRAPSTAAPRTWTRSRWWATSGAVRSVVMGPSVTIRIGEQDLRDEISRYLAVVASGRDADVRRMVLNATGTGTRRLFVSYISEVPIWKSTYRLVLPEHAGETPRLQGWAIVDNTIGEDWTNVQLSLVAGAPQSFLQEIYANGGMDGDALRTALQPIRDKQLQLQAIEVKGAQLTDEESTLVQDQTRLRENMKALRGSKEEKALTLRYTRQLGEQEDRVAALREQIRAATVAREALLVEVERMLEAWAFELVSPWPL